MVTNAEMPTLKIALQEYERQGIFQESGGIFRNAAYFIIKLKNALTQVSCIKVELQYRIIPYPLPPS